MEYIPIAIFRASIEQAETRYTRFKSLAIGFSFGGTRTRDSDPVPINRGCHLPGPRAGDEVHVFTPHSPAVSIQMMRSLNLAFSSKWFRGHMEKKILYVGTMQCME